MTYDEIINQLASQLREKHGSHRKAAKAIQVDWRRYADWRNKHSIRDSYKLTIISHMQAGLNGSLPKQRKAANG